MQADNRYPYLREINWETLLTFFGGFTLGWVFVGIVAKIVWHLIRFGWNLVP